MPPDKVAWVAKLSCGHTIGQSKPPRYDPEPAGESARTYNQYGRLQEPTAPEARPEDTYRYPPEVGGVAWCPEDNDGATVEGVVTSAEEPRPRLDWHRAGRPSGAAADL